MANRLRGRYGYPKEKPFAVTFHYDKLDEPLHWKKPQRVFVCSMGDLFHERVRDDWIWSIFHVMCHSPQKKHTFLTLTKRPENALAFLKRNSGFYWGENVWLGTTCENGDYRWRIDKLREIPAALRFVSFEPLLADMPDINWGGIGWAIMGCESGPGRRECNPEWVYNLVGECHAAHVLVWVKQVAYEGKVIHDANQIAAILGRPVEQIRQMPGKEPK
jgi:protein gp37